MYSTANGLIAAVDALQELFDNVTGQNQQAEAATNSGGSAARKQATDELGNLAYSIASSVQSYASTIGDRSLVDRMSYSRWEITRGRASSIIARCQGIHAAATDLLPQLADYLVASADLKSLEKKITAFEEAYIKPRQGTVSGAAARARNCRACSRRRHRFSTNASMEWCTSSRRSRRSSITNTRRRA